MTLEIATKAISEIPKIYSYETAEALLTSGDETVIEAYNALKAEFESLVRLQRIIVSMGFKLFDVTTSNLNFLLSRAEDIIKTFNLKGAKYEDLDMLIAIKVAQSKLGVLNARSVWDTCVTYFDKLAPSGYYFGVENKEGSVRLGWWLLPQQAEVQ